MTGSPISSTVGALATPDMAAQLAGRLIAALSAGEVAVASNAVTSYAGALGGGASMVLAIGTGSVALALGGGVMRRLDGWGPLLGDEGSGGWIGLHGVRTALRAADGRGPLTALRASAERLFGPPAGWPAKLDPARTMAHFAPEVARAAAAGDAMADSILCDAAGYLAATARDAASAFPPGARCTITGGLVGLGAPLMHRLERPLSEAAIKPVSAQGGALDDARLLATRTHLPHEAHVMRRRAYLEICSSSRSRVRGPKTPIESTTISMAKAISPNTPWVPALCRKNPMMKLAKIALTLLNE